MSKVFYEYYRKSDKLKGVVMCIGKDTYGWSMCDSKDTYNRALKADTLSKKEKEAYYAKRVPQSLRNLFDKIQDRSKRYYK
jgi:hypothetical protein